MHCGTSAVDTFCRYKQRAYVNVNIKHLNRNKKKHFEHGVFFGARQAGLYISENADFIFLVGTD